jgi:hypothetical protein
MGLGLQHRVLIGPSGGVVGKHRKVHIPAEEKHYFYEGRSFQVWETPLGPSGSPSATTRCSPSRYAFRWQARAYHDGTYSLYVWAICAFAD